MGSSLGLALKKRGVDVEVRAYARRAETRDAALEVGAADAVFSDPVEAVQGADMVVFCVPILKIPELAKACLSGLSPEAVLTDVGSTKAELAILMDGLLAGTDVVFVGSHPICGSEQQGIEAGKSNLYKGAVTVVTPQADAVEGTVSEVSNLWKSVGASVRVMSPETHDEILATTSHLPHMVAATLVRSVNDGLFCGTGFLDTTRVAAGSPEVWSDIVQTNAPALKSALKVFQEHLDELNSLIDAADGEKLSAWFATARDKRKELLG